MKRVIIFLLTAAIAVAFLGFAHTSVTASQDALLIYPAYETGDSTPLQGLTAEVSFLCGEHLRWDSTYAFGGDTVTEFAYSADPWYSESNFQASLDVYFSGGVSASTSGGSFSIGNSEYGALLRAASASVGDSETKTTNLRMEDYVNYYLPDFDLDYYDGTRRCEQSMSLLGWLGGDTWYETPQEYEAFFDGFRFPVQPDHIVAVTVGKNDMRQIIDIGVEPLNGPELYFVSDVNAYGIWFVPVFQDENGNPLPYESPAGHGVYYAPWKVTGQSTYYGEESVENITPDMDALELLVPLDENRQILDMEIDAENGTLWMLTREDSACVLTRINLDTGESLRSEALPLDADSEDTYAQFDRDDGYLLVTAQDRLALLSETDCALLLTAPDITGEASRATHFNPNDGCIRFDGTHLILAVSSFRYDGAFWTAVWEQDAIVYYGEYDCSLLRGNDDWYYATITSNWKAINLR